MLTGYVVDISASATRLDGNAFVRELGELKAKAQRAEELEKNNATLQTRIEGMEKKIERLKNTLADVQRELEASKNNSWSKMFLADPEPGLQSVGVQADLDGDERYTALVNRFNTLYENQQELGMARKELEKKLREKRGSERKWITYATGMEKRKAELEEVLRNHGLATPTTAQSGGGIVIKTPSISPLTSPEVSFEVQEADEPQLPEIGKLQRVDELRGSRDSEDPRGLKTPSSRTMDAALIPQGVQDHQRSDQSHNSSSTQGEVEADPTAMENVQFITPATLVKVESASEIPIVVSSRSVRKRKNRDGEASKETPETPKVKIEVITSSPLSLTNMRHLLPHESMDLDEIGEKVNTPKKRRQLLEASRNFNTHTTNVRPDPQDMENQRLIDFNIRAGGPQHPDTVNRPRGNPSALQPASPNKQILPRTSGHERQPKRRRLEDQVRGAAIFSEDAENGDSLIKEFFNIQTASEKLQPRSPADATELNRRLSGLLEKPSPGRPILTPAKASPVSVTAASLRPEGKSERYFTPGQQPTNSLRCEGNGFAPRNKPGAQDTPTTKIRDRMARNEPVRTPNNITTFDPNSSSHTPFRKRSFTSLGLSHFKVNPNFNQGYDYAFTDVVRGREQRKCLPGCTKPECCGTKFRKFVELSARPSHEQTLSQEEEDSRLLEEYMGDNKSRLRTMSRSERSELLIQARTRELAQKAGKHRHAYERRRSPPGFWRTDFPSTQELAADRVEAAKRERELVQQRYEEAMRPGGRWIFRDE